MFTTLLHVYPSTLKIPFQLNKVATSLIRLANVSDQHVAFKVKTNSPRNYSVTPNVGIIGPGSTCVVHVVRRAETKALLRSSRKEKFLVQSIMTEPSMTTTQLTSEMFSRVAGNDVEEHKITVVLVSANPPSPIPEGPEDSSSSDQSDLEYNVRENKLVILTKDKSQTPKAAAVSEDKKMAVDWTAISKLIEERTEAMLENQKLNIELDILRQQICKGGEGVSILWMLTSFLIGFLVGHILL
ncbi:hypothetical protein Droror1_Dr00009623 [Drosera rotundifolia]